MFADRESLVLWVAVFVMFVGVLGVVIARLGPGGAGSRVAGALALACLILVGAISIGSMESCGRCWLIFATTLPLMAVGATIDLRKSATRTAF